jgi:hypothetical protein
MKSLPLLLAAVLAAAALAAAGLTKGAVVRAQLGGGDPTWHEGRITVTPDGCTMVSLDQPTKDGYKLLGLVTLLHLELKTGAKWTDVALRPLIAQEPKQCLEGAD